MNFNYETLMYAQLILETLIIIFLFVLIFKKNKSIASFQHVINIKENLEKTLKEAEQSTNRLLSAIKEQEIFSEKLNKELSYKKDEYEDLLKKVSKLEFLNNEKDSINFNISTPTNINSSDSLKSDDTAASDFKVKELILKMHKEGKSLDEIANETGLHLSEVELIINYAKTIK